MEYDASFLAEIFEHLEVGIFVLDAEGRYVYINRAYCELFNQPPSYFDNMSIPKWKERKFLSVSVWEQVVERKAPVMALMTITNMDTNRVYHHFTSGVPSFNPDGSIKYIFYMVEPLESINQRIQSGILNRLYMSGRMEQTDEPGVGIVAESPVMKELLALLATVARSDASILFTGPTGTGKQVLAEYAHRVSARSNKAFIGIDCAAIPESLLESELFGYNKGAFTGASAQGKKGQIELADGGTLFLDEINSMPLGVQAKLLHVLETRRVRRIGAYDERPVDFRLMCATNENLEGLVQSGKFRSDLYYRISVVPIKIPPLKERKQDIAQLVFMFLQLFCNKYSCIKVLSEDALNAILDYDWPGNVRELRNFIERIVVTSPETDLMVENIPSWLLQSIAGPTAETRISDSAAEACISCPPVVYDKDLTFRKYMDDCEKRLLTESIARFTTPARVAEALGMDLSSVYRKLRKYGL